MLTVKTFIPKIVLKVPVTLREILYEVTSTQKKSFKEDCKNIHRKNNYADKIT